MYNRRDFTKKLAASMALAAVPFAALGKAAAAATESTEKFKTEWPIKPLDMIPPMKDGDTRSYTNMEIHGPMTINGWGYDIEGEPTRQWILQNTQQYIENDLVKRSYTFTRVLDYIGPDGTILEHESMEIVGFCLDPIEDLEGKLKGLLDTDGSLEEICKYGFYPISISMRRKHTPLIYDENQWYMSGYDLSIEDQEITMVDNEGNQISYGYTVDELQMTIIDSVKHMEQKTKETPNSLDVLSDHFYPCKLSYITYEAPNGS